MTDRVFFSRILSHFRYFDRTGCGYIKVEDMRRLLHSLGLGLPYRAVKDLASVAQEVSAMRGGHSSSDRIYYRDLTDIEIPPPPPPPAPVVVLPAGDGKSETQAAKPDEVMNEEVDGKSVPTDSNAEPETVQAVVDPSVVEPQSEASVGDGIETAKTTEGHVEALVTAEQQVVTKEAAGDVAMVDAGEAI